jgi:hypothetical protein
MNWRRRLRYLRFSKISARLLDRLSWVTRLGNYWYWLEDPDLKDGIEIASIVSPLRYDVLVRSDFFAFYAAQRELYHCDFETFVKLAKKEPYYIWYIESEAVRCLPHLRGNTERLDRHFVHRLKKTAALYESVMQEGYTPEFPIILKTAEHLLPPTASKLAPPTGKLISGRYFMADGCHRLALLMALGYTVLPANYFRVKCFRRFSPFDSTSMLAQTLPIEPAAYFAFLSSRYCSPHRFEDKESFLEYIRQHKPELLPEVISVIQVDGFDHASVQAVQEGLCV